jgi:hypothetical protein
LALDEPNESDNVYEVKGFTFAVNKELMERAESIRIDLSYMGFQVESGQPLGSGGGSCSSCSSCG